MCKALFWELPETGGGLSALEVGGVCVPLGREEVYRVSPSGQKEAWSKRIEMGKDRV